MMIYPHGNGIVIMRKVCFHKYGGVEVLQLEEIKSRKLEGGEIRIKTKAIGVNPVDTYFRGGAYKVPQLPWTPGSDFAGVVEEIGSKKSDLKVGDRVYGTGLGRDIDGTYSESIIAPQNNLAVLPDQIEFEEGAAIALVGVTAWRALVDHANLISGEKCLIHGGSGGVGHVAVQIAEGIGAEVTTTARSEYHEKLKQLGAKHVFDYNVNNLTELIGNTGQMDVILDHRCDEYMELNIQVASKNARIVGIGQEDTQVIIPNFAIARAKELELYMMSMFNTPNISTILDHISKMMVEGSLEVSLAKKYPLEAAGEAQERIYSQSNMGKIVIIP